MFSKKSMLPAKSPKQSKPVAKRSNAKRSSMELFFKAL